MLMQSLKYKFLKRFPKILLVILIVVSLITALFALLFGVNRFSLVLTPQGEERISLGYGEMYSDPGAEAKLMGSIFFKKGIPVDVSILVQGKVDPCVVGNYQIRYSANYHGLQAEAKRIIQITDDQPPWITLEVIPGHYTIPGEEYQEEGFSAFDEYDGDLSPRVHREEKDGMVHYRVADSSGNETHITRKIRYYDPIAPEITLLSEETIYLESGTAYQEPGCLAWDNVDGDVTRKVTTEGEVDRYLSGTYQLIYHVCDSSGNQATGQRTVIVTPKAQPDIKTPSGKVIYLTFDDGPGPWTEELLNILKAYNVKATFFVIDSEYDHLLKRIVEEEHAIGIHSVTHDYSKIYENPGAFFADLLRMQAIIQEQTGVTTTLMRFPGGSSNTVSSFSPGIMTYLTRAVEDMGFQYFDWNVDSNDAGGARKADTVYDNVCKGVEKQNISVVLQHDIKEFSVEAVERIINWGMENGYTFLPLTPNSPAIHHGVNN